MYSQETRIYFALLVGMISLLLLMAFFIITIVRYQRNRSLHKKEIIQEQFKNLEIEKERVAIDLHDDLGSMLSAIKLRLQFIQPKVSSMQVYLDFANEEIDALMHKLRRISQNIMPSALKRKGLKEALEELTDYMMQPMGIVVHYFATKVEGRPETLVHLFRIAQEILNNIIKHSSAHSVYITLKQDRGGITLQIKDDGIGFNQRAVSMENKGTGLKNIMARVEIIDAKIYLSTQPGKGVDFLIKIPAP